MHDGWLQAAAVLPAPQFILTAAVLMVVSFGGFPVPITATLLLAGALTVRMAQSGQIFLALIIVLALVLSGRDLVTYYLARQSSRWLQRRMKRVHEQNLAFHDARSSVRSTAIRGATQRPPLWLRRGDPVARVRLLAALRRLLDRWGGPVLVLSRISPLASPCDVAAGIASMPMSIYAPSVTIGRFLFVGLWLGAGALSGQAWQHGASVPQLASIISGVLVALIIIPAVLSRRWLLAEVNRPIIKDPLHDTDHALVRSR